MKRASAVLAAFALLLPLLVRGHVGSPTIFYEGMAGPYPVRVTVRPPDVVPGLADISVRVLTNGPQRVAVLPVRWNTGRKGAPTPDDARLVRGETNLHSAQLWLMTSGAYSIFVEVTGATGTGTTLVPVNSVATRTLGMTRTMGAALAAVGVFLFAAMISIVGAAVRESALAPGEAPPQGRVWRARLSMAAATLVLALALYGGHRWWQFEEADYRNNRLYEPDPVEATVLTNADPPVLRLALREGRRHRGPLVPDHGKLMHAFLIREGGMDAFAHLHPVRAGKDVYQTPLPPLPPGRYRLFADVTQETGFTQTLLAEIDLDLGRPSPTPQEASAASAPAGSQTAAPSFDPDDAWLLSGTAGSPALPTADRVTVCPLDDGLAMIWERPAALSARRETTLRFRVRDTAGRAARLEPYLDMAGHAVIQRADGSVFTHLHPFGTISMASQQLFVQRENAAVKNEKPLEIFCGLPPSDEALTFPYEFPKPGRYRIWVQVKSGGRVRTGVFDAEVGG